MNEHDPITLSTTLQEADLFDWRDYRIELQESGYTPDAPESGWDDDADIARGLSCPICGRQMEFRPMMDEDGDYLAFAVCEPCDKAFEF